MTPAPEVTVVIPTKNRWSLLSSALRGALWQEGVDLEVIVVDDGSTDETPDRLAELDDPRLRVIRNERSQGVARARNLAIAEARGEWMAFLDDDDIWSPEKLRIQVQTATDQDADFAYVRAVVVDERWRVVATVPVAEPDELWLGLVQSNVVGGPSCVTVRTELVRDIGGFDEDLAVLADWDLWIRVMDDARASLAPGYLIGHLVHPFNMHHRAAGYVIDEFHKLADKHRQRGLDHRVDFDAAGFARWIALGHRRAGHRLRAAGAYLLGAVEYRSASNVARAAGVVFSERTLSRVRGDVGGDLLDIDWLELYRREVGEETGTTRVPAEQS